MTTDFLEVHKGQAPVIIAFPHTGTDIPFAIEDRLVSGSMGRKDADWWIHKLYDFAAELGVTTVRTTISRTVIDVNRDPSGASLYPGQATTELCPTVSFDGEALYRSGQTPDEAEIAQRRQAWFDPYHQAIASEIARLMELHPRVVLYDAHSIRSGIPRLFEGELPQFNIGTNGGATCDPALSLAISQLCGQSGFSHVVNGRFKGGWTTRHYGRPLAGVHAIQMELACRGYMDEPDQVTPDNWPTPYDPARAEPLRDVLVSLIQAALGFARS
ncbi:MAG: N-formylglutamate deformylase [Asticcacaulis sp.]